MGNKTISMTLAMCSLIFFTFGLSAGNETPQYVIFYYNVRSDGTALTDQECASIFETRLVYDIVQDVPVYQKNKSYSVSNYKRIDDVFVNSTTHLFGGSADIEFSVRGSKYSQKMFSNFVLLKDLALIRGSFSCPGLCRGSLIGLDQRTNDQWKNKAIGQ